MTLITPELRKITPLLYGNEGKDVKDMPITAKFFTPWSNWSWYMTELDEGDNIAFGFTAGLDSELGYFSIKELEALQGPGGIKVERDLYFGRHSLSEVLYGARP